MTQTLDIVQPAHLWVPERRGSYGAEVVDLAREAGRVVDAEQELAIDAMASYGPGGKWLTLESAIVEARQNGKTNGVLVPIVLADLFLWGADEIGWTAHLFRTTRKAFAEFVRCIEFSSALSRRVKNISTSHGEESIELTSGAVLSFLARSMGGGRGLSGKRLVFDEAGILGAEAMGALLPTMATRENAQVLYGASAGLLKSKHLRKLRNRGRAGGDPSLIWAEWGDDGSWENPPCEQGAECSHIYGVPGCALDDEARWLRANHTLGKRISYEYVRSERRTLDPIEFGRERLGWWEDPPNEEDEVELAKAKKAWPGLADPGESAPAGAVAIAVAVPQDRSSTSIAVTWRPVTYTVDGVVQGRLMVMVKQLVGTLKAVSTIVDLVKAHEVLDLSLHAGGPTGALLADLAGKLAKPEAMTPGGRQVEPRAVSTTEATQATGAFIDLVTNAGVGHLDQPELNGGWVTAKLKAVGSSSVWVTAGLSNVSLFAATLSTNGFVKHAGDELPPADIF